MIKRSIVLLLMIATLADVLAGPAIGAPPTHVRLRAEPGTGCGTLPETQSCINLTVSVKNYSANPFAWTLYVRPKRSGENVEVTDGIVGVNDTGTLTFGIFGNVCDQSHPWWVFTISSPDVLESNVVKAC